MKKIYIKRIKIIKNKTKFDKKLKKSFKKYLKNV